MTVKPIEERFIPYLQVELPPAEMLRVRRHLEGDAAARRRLRDMELTLRLLQRALGEGNTQGPGYDRDTVPLRPGAPRWPVPARSLCCENARNVLRPG